MQKDQNDVLKVANEYRKRAAHRARIQVAAASDDLKDQLNRRDLNFPTNMPLVDRVLLIEAECWDSLTFLGRRNLIRLRLFVKKIDSYASNDNMKGWSKNRIKQWDSRLRFFLVVYLLVAVVPRLNVSLGSVDLAVLDWPAQFVVDIADRLVGFVNLLVDFIKPALGLVSLDRRDMARTATSAFLSNGTFTNGTFTNGTFAFLSNITAELTSIVAAPDNGTLTLSFAIHTTIFIYLSFETLALIHTFFFFKIVQPLTFGIYALWFDAIHTFDHVGSLAKSINPIQRPSCFYSILKFLLTSFYRLVLLLWTILAYIVEVVLTLFAY